MARINIEDDLFKDFRFTDLCIKTGSMDSALGSLVRCWIVAQKYWKRDKSRIPVDVWKSQKLNDALIETGWVKHQPDHGGYFADGSEKNFAWLLQKVEAGHNGGIASAETKKHEINNLASSGDKRGQAQSSEGNPPTPSPTLPPPLSSYSNSHSSISFDSANAESTPKKTRKVLTKEQKTLNAKIWDAYLSAYLKRYHVEPTRNAMVNGQISRLRERLGDEAPSVVVFYLQHNDTKYLKQTHSIGLCLQDAETLRTQFLRGKAITNLDVKRFEKAQATQTIINEAKDGGF